MSQPVQNLRHTRQFGPLGQDRTVDHQHRQAQRPRGVQLGACTSAACVFGHHQIRSVALHQRPVICFGKGPARYHHVTMRQGQSLGFIHQAQQIVMLGLRREILKMHPAHSQKDALRLTGQYINRPINIRNVTPPVTSLRTPRRTGQRGQWHLCVTTGGNGVLTHLCSKGVGGIDHMRNCVIAQIACQPFDPAKPADAHRQGLGARIVHAPGIRICRPNTLPDHGFSQRISLGRAAKDQEVFHA